MVVETNRTKTLGSLIPSFLPSPLKKKYYFLLCVLLDFFCGGGGGERERERGDGRRGGQRG
jgi:hypothetical protein